MSKFLEDARALLEKVAQGSADSAETKGAVTALIARVAENDALDADQSTIIKELLQRLAESTPAGGGDTGGDTTSGGDGA